MFFQKFNADFDLSAKEGADSLAFISLIEEKLRPALVRPRPLLPPLWLLWLEMEVLRGCQP